MKCSSRTMRMANPRTPSSAGRLLRSRRRLALPWEGYSLFWLLLRARTMGAIRDIVNPRLVQRARRSLLPRQQPVEHVRQILCPVICCQIHWLRRRLATGNMLIRTRIFASVKWDFAIT
jgi:hypothetical protein